MSFVHLLSMIDLNCEREEKSDLQFLMDFALYIYARVKIQIRMISYTQILFRPLSLITPDDNNCDNLTHHREQCKRNLLRFHHQQQKRY